ncbi:hypothetical protein C8Q76DRAFT_748115 [Earliella scabrosa]|nr:hypothetical protein C8Q76DRAFT_748115 [Earliella scabrosa]
MGMILVLLAAQRLAIVLASLSYTGGDRRHEHLGAYFVLDRQSSQTTLQRRWQVVRLWGLITQCDIAQRIPHGLQVLRRKREKGGHGIANVRW